MGREADNQGGRQADMKGGRDNRRYVGINYEGREGHREGGMDRYTVGGRDDGSDEEEIRKKQLEVGSR